MAGVAGVASESAVGAHLETLGSHIGISTLRSTWDVYRIQHPNPPAGRMEGLQPTGLTSDTHQTQFCDLLSVPKRCWLLVSLPLACFSAKADASSKPSCSTDRLATVLRADMDVA